MSFRDVLAIDVMRRVWYAQVVSLFGDFLALFAVIAVVSFALHGSPNQIIGVQIAYLLPIVFVGPIAGVFVDRWPLKPTLVASDLIRALLALLLIVSASLWQIYLVLAALSCVSAFFGPAQQVTIRAHVPATGLISANALMQIAFMAAGSSDPRSPARSPRASAPTSAMSWTSSAFWRRRRSLPQWPIHRPLAAPPPAESRSNRIHAIWIDLRAGISFMFHHTAVLFVVIRWRQVSSPSAASPR